MDDVTNAVVDIVEIMPATAIPHVELLGYRDAPPHAPVLVGPRDRAATRLVLAARDVTSPKLVRDPDGHWIQLVAA